MSSVEADKISARSLLDPVSSDGTALTFADSGVNVIDRCPAGSRQEFSGAKLVAVSGAASGAPTTISFPFILQHSDAQGSGFANYTDPQTGDVVTVTLTGENELGELAVDLSAAKQYLSLALDGTFTGGSSPELVVSAALILTGAKEVPV